MRWGKIGTAGSGPCSCAMRTEKAISNTQSNHNREADMRGSYCLCRTSGIKLPRVVEWLRAEPCRNGIHVGIKAAGLEWEIGCHTAEQCVKAIRQAVEEYDIGPLPDMPWRGEDNPFTPKQLARIRAARSNYVRPYASPAPYKEE